MFYFLVRGDRGLYYSDGKRTYFPDRSWKEAREGIFTDMEITRDKETYAFIRGTMVDLEYISLKEAFENTSYDRDMYYREVKFGGSNLIVKYQFSDYTFIFKSGGKVIVSNLNTMDAPKNRADYVDKFLSEIYRRGTSVVVPLELISGELTVRTEDNTFLLSCIRILHSLNRRHLLGRVDVKEFRLLERDLILVDNVSRYGIQEQYIFSMVGDYEPQLVVQASKFSGVKTVAVLSYKELEDYCVSHYIYVGGIFSKGLTITHTLRFDNDKYDITAWNGSTYTFELEESSTKKAIVQSFEELKAAQKSIGKYCRTPQAIEKLRGLNPKPWLIGDKL